MRMELVGAAIAPLMMIAIPVQAQDRAVASAEIHSGAYDKAEQKLLAGLRADPNRPELLLNLAVVYAQTGRTSEARALYARVLEQDDVLMDMAPDRSAGAHAIAKIGLRRINAVQLSAR